MPTNPKPFCGLVGVYRKKFCSHGTCLLPGVPVSTGPRTAVEGYPPTGFPERMQDAALKQGKVCLTPLLTPRPSNTSCSLGGLMFNSDPLLRILFSLSHLQFLPAL